MKEGLPGIIADIYMRLAEMDRRRANAKRKGVVHQIDDEKGLYRVKLGEDSDGQPFLSPWLPNQEMAMGDVRIATGLTLGEQVDIVSETGDLADAEIVSSIQQDKFKRPPVKPGELRIRREKDDTEIYLGPEKIQAKIQQALVEVLPTHVLLKLQGATVEVNVDKITLKIGGSEIELSDGGISYTARGQKFDVPSTFWKGDIGQQGYHIDSAGKHA